MKNGLYNIDVYWPDCVNNLVKATLAEKISLVCSAHYCEQAKRNGVNANAFKAVLFGRPVEISVMNDKITRMVVRLKDRYVKNTDICFSLSLLFDHERSKIVAIVNSVWKNSVSDNHKTKNIEKYVHEEA